jgi:hypothetical protein
VRGPKGARCDAIPFRIVPERGQIPEYAVEATSQESGDVFQDDEERSNLANDPCSLGPERAGVVPAEPRAGGAERLAGEAGTDDLGAAPRRVERVDVAVAGNARPVPRKDAPRPRVELALPDGAPETSSLKAKLEATDSREEGADSEVKHEPPRCRLPWLVA